MPLPLVLAAPTIVNGVTLLVGGVVVADSINQSLRNNVNKGYSDNYNQKPLDGFQTVPILGTNRPSSPPENPVWDGKSTGTGGLENKLQDSRSQALRDSYMPLVGAAPSPPQSTTQAQGKSSSVPTPRGSEILQRNLLPQLGSSADLFRDANNSISNSVAATGGFSPKSPNFPFFFSDPADKENLEKLLKQREAREADAGRINNAPPPIIAPIPFKGGQSSGVAYRITLSTRYAWGNGANEIQTNTFICDTYFNSSNLLFGKILAVYVNPSNNRVEVKTTAFANGAFLQGVGYTDAPASFLDNTGVSKRTTITSVNVARQDGTTDIGGDLPSNITFDRVAAPPPIYPNRANFERSDKPQTVQNSDSGKPIVKPVVPSSSVKPFKEPDKPKPFDVQQPDTSKNPNIVQNPSGFVQIFPTSFTTTGVNDQPQTVTKKEPSLFEQATADFDKYYAYPISPGHGITRGVNSDFGASPDTLKGKAFTGVKQPQKPEALYDKGTQTVPNSPSKPPDTRTPNTTPETPVKQTENDNNLPQTIAALLGITALLGAMKVGSDAFINASLPKINNIENNTSPTAQQTNAKQGVCDAMQPNQCGFEGVKQATTEATNPIKDVANANNGMLANILSALANLASTIATLFSNVIGKLDAIKDLVGGLWNNGLIDKAMQYMTMITVIHNAAMLSRSIADTLGSALDSGLQALGLQIKDKDGNAQGVTAIIGKSFENLIKGIIGTDNYTALTNTWIQANRIYQTGINLISNVQSILDSTTAVAELTSNRLGTWMNAARSAGIVRENAYGAQSENVTKFNAFTNKLENLEQGASNLASITGNILSVQQTVTEIQTNRQEFDNALKNKPQGTGLAENDPAKTDTADKKEKSVWTIGDFSIVKPPETP